MGCTTSDPQARKLLKVPTFFGGVHITIKDFHFNEGFIDLSTFKPYVKILVSNQYKSTKVMEKGELNMTFNEEVVIAINSCYKPYGRSMEVFVLTKNQTEKDKLVAYGLVDMDMFLKQNPTKEDIKLNLNNQYTQIGFINLTVDFVIEPKESVCFRFQTVDLQMPETEDIIQCWVKTTVGEQIMETPKYKLDSKTYPPVWGDQVYQIQIPPCVTRAKFEVMNNKKLIGRAEVDVEPFLKLNDQQAFKEEIKTNEGQKCGVFYFSVIKGADAVFLDKNAVSEAPENEKLEVKKVTQNVYQEEPESQLLLKEPPKQKNKPYMSEEKKSTQLQYGIQYPHGLDEEGHLDLP